MLYFFCPEQSPPLSSLSPKNAASAGVLPFGTVLNGSRRGFSSSSSGSSSKSKSLAPSLTGASVLSSAAKSSPFEISSTQKQSETETFNQKQQQQQGQSADPQSLTAAESSNIVHQFKFAFHNRPSHLPRLNSDSDTELLLLDERANSGAATSAANSKLPPNSRLYEAYHTGSGKRGGGNGGSGGRTSTSVHAHYLPGSTSAIYVDSSEELVDDFVAASHQPHQLRGPSHHPHHHHHHQSLFSQEGPSKYVAVANSPDSGDKASQNETDNRTVKVSNIDFRLKLTFNLNSFLFTELCDSAADASTE